VTFANNGTIQRVIAQVVIQDMKLKQANAS
jgi:hypothetical protein